MTGTRPYRQGDRLRSIHWSQTARRDSLVVTERQAAARCLVVVVCDAQAFRHDETGEVLETAIRVAASVTREFHAHHAQVRFLLGSLDITLKPGTPGLHRLLDALARYRGDEDPSQSNDTCDALTVLVTSSPPQGHLGTTELPGRVRYIFVNSQAGTTSKSAHRHQTWLKIEDDVNLSLTLRNQWERLCHDSTAS